MGDGGWGGGGGGGEEGAGGRVGETDRQTDGDQESN